MDDKLLIKNFLGINIIDCSYDYLLKNIMETLIKGGPINIMSLNLTALKRFDYKFKYYIDQFDYTTADGKGLVIFSGLLGNRIKNHLSIPRICDRLIYKCYKEKKKVFLLGAKKDINDLALLNIRKNFPGIIAIGHHGYFDLNNMGSVENEIMRFKPYIVLVGISSPKKEEVILKLSKKYKKSINVACGGYIDILSEKIEKAPEIFHRLGLEWLFRFHQEPRRMFRPMFLNGLFFIFFIFPKVIVSKIIFGNQPKIIDIMKNYNN